ncbi:disease resistance protein RPV1-like [Lycium ferocissimum]|uniref:disease resistance protein RPV1-like n=1 Tax=Lycium ferocissimum TaxID=112874 RepID=UPI0028152CB4|nr:disease resistance protein RPV1-like [Lycium ferocissimum]
MEYCRNVKSLPSSIHMRSLEDLNLSGCLKLEDFPKIVGNMDCLSELHLADTAIWKLPPSIGCLPAISLLDMSFCIELVSIPANLCNLMNLKTLILEGCSKLVTLPENFCNLKQLEVLNAAGTAISQLPDSFWRLKYLTFLSIKEGRNLKFLSLVRISFFPTPSGLNKLKRLDLSDCSFLDDEIDGINYLRSLVELNLSRNQFVYLPTSITQLSRLQFLNITYCEKLKKLPRLPRSIKDLYLDDFLARKVIYDLPCYQHLHLVSFTNVSYEQLYSGKIYSSSFLDGDHQEQTTSVLTQVLSLFLAVPGAHFSCTSNIVLSPSLDFGCRLTCGIIFPERAIPNLFEYRSKEEKISVNLPGNWYEKFQGFAICCATYMGNGINDPDLGISGNYDYTFISAKLICSKCPQEFELLETKCYMGTTSSSRSCYVCFAYIPCITFWQASGSEARNLSHYTVLEASIDWTIAMERGVQLIPHSTFGLENTRDMHLHRYTRSLSFC